MEVARASVVALQAGRPGHGDERARLARMIAERQGVLAREHERYFSFLPFRLEHGGDPLTVAVFG
jgi:hypothetical protein